MDKWVGKTAVVTGASGGIGEGTVRDFAKHGINVVGLARRSENIEKIAKEVAASGASGKVFAIKCDVTNQQSINDAFKWIEEKFGSIQILVNNAGTGTNVNLLDDGDEAGKKMDAVIDINLRGVVHCARAGYRLMKKSDDYGIIINVNSIAGHVVSDLPKMNVYSATKFAVTALTQTLRLELKSLGDEKVRVSNFSPGAVKTDIFFAAGYTKSTDKFFSRVPHMTVEDIAQTIRFLLETPYHVNIKELTVLPVGGRL